MEGAFYMRILKILTMILMFSGCMRIDEVIDTGNQSSSSKEPEIQEEDITKKTLVCTSESEETITFDAKGDEITNMTQTFYMTFDSLGITEDMDASQMEQIINDSLSQTYSDIEGVSVSGTVEDNRVKVTVNIDYETADMDVLIEKGLLKEGEMENQYISLKETQNDYTDNGYACSLD